MNTLISKVRLVLVCLGVGALALALVSVVMNVAAGTLLHPQHGMAVLGMGVLGVAFLAVGSHFQLPSGAAIAAVEKAAAPLLQKLESKAKELATTEGEKLLDIATKAARDEAGKFGITIPANQNMESLYHLAAQAAEIADPILKAKMLQLCRDLNDKLFVLHHGETPTEVSNDPKPPAKAPAAPV